jgi:hypothetical protein
VQSGTSLGNIKEKTHFTENKLWRCGLASITLSELPIETFAFFRQVVSREPNRGMIIIQFLRFAFGLISG